MISRRIFSCLLGSIALSTLVSCDTDYNEVGSNIVGDDLFQFEKYELLNIEAQTTLAEAVNTRNLPVNSLGFYNDPIYGNHTAHIVTQVEMSTASDFENVGLNPVIDSVYLYIPYAVKKSTPISGGGTDYELDKVYGNGSFDLKVFENGYFLTVADPSNNFENKYYFSDEKEVFDNNIVSPVLNNSSDTSQNTAFKFIDDEILLYAYNEDGTIQKDDEGEPIVKERKAPGVWLDLDKDYFQNKFFANNAHKNIINNSIFKNFFRGIYLQATNPNGNALAQLDISKGELVIVYKQGEASERERKSIQLKMGYSTASSNKVNATTVNLFENNYSPDFITAIANQNNPILWLKGNNATYSSIKLFGEDADNSGKPDELEQIIANKWLINQAVLTIYIDENITGNAVNTAPERLLLYDFKNNKPIVDYTIDETSSPFKSIYGGILNTNEKRYQFRLTEYITNLIQKDSTNFELGLVVANDITNSVFNVIKDQESQKIPLTSTMYPFGTVVHGPNSGNSNKKMKLEIYYTKQN